MANPGRILASEAIHPAIVDFMIRDPVDGLGARKQTPTPGDRENHR